MKRIIFFFLISLLSSTSVFSQTSGDPDLEMSRKIRRILRVESKFSELPVSINELDNVIYPELKLKQQELAPNLPEHSGLDGDELLDTMEGWISAYPEEYESYTHYLEIKYRSYRQ